MDLGLDISSLEKDELRRAMKCAREVYETMKYQKPTSINRLQTDLSSVVIETIRCIQNDTLLHTSCLHRIARYVSTDLEAPPLLKLGYALTVVIEKLMNDRAEYLASTLDESQEASTSFHVEPIQVNVQPHLVNTSRVEREVKDEPVEVKEEPLDDFDVDEIKQEELGEPEADVFCPSTGASRPLGSMDESLNERDEKGLPHVEVQERWTTMSGGPMRKKVYIVRSTGAISSASILPSGAVKLTKARYVPSAMSMQPKPKAILQKEIEVQPATYDNRKKRCFLCGQIPKEFETIPPSMYRTKRNQFLDKMIVGTSIEEENINELRRNYQTAHFCTSHIAVVPKVAPKKSNRKSSCNLCDQPKYPLSQTPPNPISRRRFFSKLINLSATQKKTVDYLLKHTEEKAQICSKHFKFLDVSTRVSGSRLVFSTRRSNEEMGGERGEPANVESPTSRNSIGITFRRMEPVQINVGHPNEEAVKEEPITEPGPA